MGKRKDEDDGGDFEETGAKPTKAAKSDKKAKVPGADKYESKADKKAAKFAGTVSFDKSKDGKGKGKDRKDGKDGKDKKRSSKDGDSGKEWKKFKPEKKKEIPHTHKEQKEQRMKRKAEGNPNFSMIQLTKAAWERARSRNASPADRNKEIATIHGAIKGKYKEIIFSHDSARVVQFVLKFGTAAQRNEVFEELKDSIIELVKFKYSKHLVPKMLKAASQEQKRWIISQFAGKVRKLIKMKIPSGIIDLCYEEYANSAERSSLVEEFYGPQFALFKVGEKRTLEDVFEAHPEKKQYILKHMKETLTPLLSKGSCTHNIVHRALLDYMTHAAEADASEMIDLVKELLVEMLHTREGARVTMVCIWRGSAKDRKAIIKSFKPYLSKIAREEYGHMTLLAAFDAVDDTVLMKKTIVQELAEEIHDLIDDQYGRKVIFYLFAHRSTMHFLPDIIALMKKGDGNAATKKDHETRFNELRQAISAPACKWVADTILNTSRDGPLSLLMMEILATAETSPEKAAAFEALAAQANSEVDPLMDHHSGHRLLRRIIPMTAGDKTFGEYLFEALGKSVASWAEKNRGAFVVTTLMVQGGASVQDKVKKVVKDHEGALKKIDLPGVKVLLETLHGKAKTPVFPETPKKDKAEPAAAAAPAAPAPMDQTPDAPAATPAKKGKKGAAAATPAPAPAAEKNDAEEEKEAVEEEKPKKAAATPASKKKQPETPTPAKEAPSAKKKAAAAKAKEEPIPEESDAEVSATPLRRSSRRTNAQ